MSRLTALARSGRKLAVAGTVMTAVAAATVGTAAAADPITPKQYFEGFVNSAPANATIQMGCFGPVSPGETGHPLAGQTVAVQRVVDPVVLPGYTGSAGTTIAVGFPGPATTSPLVFTSYGTPLAIPTSLVLPCSGSATVVFSPRPTSPTARNAIVTVTYVGQP
ncbi:hypothetical protein [Frankia sp. Cas4]|uniref:hypothetical protein n=1 Tax=Frankia sp. Cas4 TaxID=3073927 RepID=UPI002AD2CF12|nr:hypothetical protein [Frankia sp. Cas4]